MIPHPTTLRGGGMVERYTSQGGQPLVEAEVPMYVISLKAYPDKLTQFYKNFAEVGLTPNDIHWVEAVVGKDLDLSQVSITDKARYDLNMGKRCSNLSFSTMGSIGCYLSHVKVWKTFLDTGKDYCIVFEDDTKPTSYFTYDNIVYLLEFLNKVKVDICMLYYSPNRIMTKTLVSPMPYPPGDSIRLYRSSLLMYGTNAYLISRDYILRLLDKVFPMEVQIDGFLALQSINDKDVQFYICDPPIAESYSKWSSTTGDGKMCINCNKFDYGLGDFSFVLYKSPLLLMYITITLGIIYYILVIRLTRDG